MYSPPPREEDQSNEYRMSVEPDNYVSGRAARGPNGSQVKSTYACAIMENPSWVLS